MNLMVDKLCLRNAVFVFEEQDVNPKTLGRPKI